MYNVLLIFFTFILTTVFIKASYKPALIIGLVDVPSGRKNHIGEVPLTGGLAVFLAISVSAILQGQQFDQFHLFFASLFILAFTGLLDDLHELSTLSRLLAQVCAALLMVLLDNVCLINLGNLMGFGDVTLKGFAIPFTVFCVVGVINAINLIDGIDGLAGGTVLIALVLFGSAAVLRGMTLFAILIYMLASAVFAFICFNMRSPWRVKAEVFLGDAGSTMLGFALAWIAVVFTSQGDSSLSPIAAVWIIGVPILDTLSLMIRRILKGGSPLSADREHIHHVLDCAGFSNSQIILMILSASLAMGLFGLGGWYIGIPEYIMFYTFVLVFIIYFFVINHAWKTMETYDNFP